jgi:hypothetical protein
MIFVFENDLLPKTVFGEQVVRFYWRGLNIYGVLRIIKIYRQFMKLKIDRVQGFIASTTSVFA